MAETLAYTATTPTADAGSKSSTLSLWIPPAVEQRLLGVKLYGNNQGEYEILDQGGPVVPYVAEVYVTGTSANGKRTEIQAWYDLLWTAGSLVITQDDFSDTLSNMVLTGLTPPPNIEAGTLAIGLEFVRYI